MSYAVCLMDDYLEVEEYYESCAQAALYHNIHPRQVISLIKHFPKQHKTKKCRFQYFDQLRQPEIWMRHPWLDVYVSCFGRVDKDGVKGKVGQDKYGQRKGMEIGGEWYTYDELMRHTFPLI